MTAIQIVYMFRSAEKMCTRIMNSAHVLTQLGWQEAKQRIVSRLGTTAELHKGFIEIDNVYDPDVLHSVFFQ